MPSATSNTGLVSVVVPLSTSLLQLLAELLSVTHAWPDPSESAPRRTPARAVHGDAPLPLPVGRVAAHGPADIGLHVVDQHGLDLADRDLEHAGPRRDADLAGRFALGGDEELHLLIARRAGDRGLVIAEPGVTHRDAGERPAVEPVVERHGAINQCVNARRDRDADVERRRRGEQGWNLAHEPDREEPIPEHRGRADREALGSLWD